MSTTNDALQTELNFRYNKQDESSLNSRVPESTSQHWVCWSCGRPPKKDIGFSGFLNFKKKTRLIQKRSIFLQKFIAKNIGSDRKIKFLRYGHLNTRRCFVTCVACRKRPLKSNFKKLWPLINPERRDAPGAKLASPPKVVYLFF